MDKVDELRRLAAPITDVYIGLEQQLMVNVSKYLSGDSSAAGTAEWNMEKLRELSALRDSNYAIIAGTVHGLDQNLLEILKEAGDITAADINSIFVNAIRAGLVDASIYGKSDNPLMGAILNQYYQSAKDKLNLANTTLLHGASQSYVDIINKTTGAVLTGVDTPQVALRNAVKEFADAGIPALVDKAGREWTPEAYIDNVIRSTSNNVANDMQFARMDEYGVDLIEVSSHMGARPKCAPFQGRIFSRSGKAKGYDAWSSTSYGDAGGLLGCNCRHVIYPFIEGISNQRYTPYDEKANAKAYQQSQVQRKIERDIRAAKREKEMFDALGDTEASAKAADKIRAKQAQMREFINETGLPRQYAREQIVPMKGGTSKTNVPVAAVPALPKPPTSAKEAKDFSELSTYMADKYGVKVSDALKGLDFESVRESAAGIEKVLEEFPKARGQFTALDVGAKNAVMSASLSGRIEFSGHYYADSSKAAYSVLNDYHYHPTNHSIFGTGAHEAGHLLEGYLDKQLYPLPSVAWSDCTVAKDIVSEAAKAAKKTAAGKGKTISDLQREISGYANDTRIKGYKSETLAEAVEDVVINGDNAAPLSKEIWRILKVRLG